MLQTTFSHLILPSSMKTWYKAPPAPESEIKAVLTPCSIPPKPYLIKRKRKICHVNYENGKQTNRELCAEKKTVHSQYVKSAANQKTTDPFDAKCSIMNPSEVTTILPITYPDDLLPSMSNQSLR